MLIFGQNLNDFDPPKYLGTYIERVGFLKYKIVGASNFSL